MRSERPLKVRPVPGEYLCTWHIPVAGGGVREVSGSLELEAERQPLGSMHGDVPMEVDVVDGTSSMAFPQQQNFPILRGQLVTGEHVSLLGAVLSVWSPGRAVIDAHTALIGLYAGAADEAVGFTRMKIQVEYLDTLSMHTPLKSFKFPSSTSVYLDQEWSVTGNPDSTYVWRDDDSEVTYSFDGSSSWLDPYGFRIGFSPTVVITNVTAMPFEWWYDQWVEPLRRLVCVATTRKVQVTYLALGLDASSDKVTSASRQHLQQVYGRAVTQAPYASDRDVIRKNPSVMMLDSGSGVSLLNMLRSWQVLDGGHHPLLETYGAFVGEAQHPRSHYLLLLQALEGQHGYDTREKRKTRTEDHCARREQVLSAARDALSSKDRAWLNKYLNKQPMAGLDEALRSTINSLPVDLSERLDKTALVQEVRQDVRIDSMAGALRQIRNDLAHGNRGYDVADLYEVTQLLEQITRAHLLRTLGCPDSMLMDCLQDRGK